MVLNELAAFIHTMIYGVRIDAAATKEAATEGYVVIKPHILKGSNLKQERLSHGECSEGDDICCVCLSSMEEGVDDMRVLPCLHQFHKGCVDRWLDGCRKNCPMCRFSIGEEERFRIREAFTEEMLIWFSSFHVAGF